MLNLEALAERARVGNPGPSKAWALFGGILFLTVLAVRLAAVPSQYWRWRDDAVITLSHSLGWALTGTPSVSASAERVEGFTAPLQFLLASAYFALGGSGWARFLDVQVILGCLATGYFVTRFLQSAMPSLRFGTVALASALSAVIGFWTWPSAGWFASGMENSLTVPLLAAAMAMLARLNASTGWALGVALGLAGISRTEWFVLLVPALVVVAGLGWKELVDRLAAVRAIVVALSIWLLVHPIRLAVFGSLVPNSASVQGKSSISIEGAVVLLAIGGSLLLAAITLVLWPWTLRLLPAFAALGLAVAILTRTIDGPQRLIAQEGAMLGALLLLGVALFAAGIGPPLTWLSWVVIGMTPVAQYLLLGPARLDDSRVLSMALILLAPASGVLLMALLDNRVTRQSSIALLLVGASCAGVYVLGSGFVRTPTDLCCAIEDSVSTLETARRVSESRGLPRVILANPDLGKVSFAKETVTADLGLLGDPLLQEASSRGSDAEVQLLNRVIVPDVVVIHGYWLCRHRDWIESSAFSDTYEAVQVTADPSVALVDCPLEGARVTYVRRDTPEFDREADLASDLANRPEEAELVVRRSLEACGAEAGDQLRCQWIRRAIQRASPELRAAGVHGDVAEVVKRSSPTAEFDYLLLTTPPGWAQRASDVADTWQASD